MDIGRFLIIVGLTIIGINLIVVPFLENRMIYFPEKSIINTPDDVGLSFQSVLLTTNRGSQIQGWFMDQPKSEKVVLFFHGNAGNMGYFLDFYSFFYDLGYSVFTIDYSGYGNSLAKPSEKNIYADAQAAYQYLTNTQHIDPDHIVCVGWSLGSAPASFLATKHKMGHLILMSPLSSAPDVAADMLPFFIRPLIWIRTQLNVVKFVTDVHIPLMIIHSEDDEMLPIDMAIKIYDHANEPKQLHRLHSLQHNDVDQLLIKSKDPISAFLSD